ncbi:hypothetical protein VST7929_00574 [Vibrio stylophorae]|uniref:PilZ domain-containing protein n=1 Tax=Vibrio stylophorae TaxID=659351 RepID=A0ABN8DRA4_9VIBR|nr:PilZ domain-containing protein [Vibrio stylophorae]CAH0532729.1 hypothetical protein VST7929_00574 [Vibrio stylophorae]
MPQNDYNGLIEQLIPLYDDPAFATTLARFTKGLPPSAELIIKMELKRLYTPCTKPIDLRGRVQGECRKYRLNQVEHWLDDVAVNLYPRVLTRFGNRYTQGCWEMLTQTHNSYRMIEQRRKQQIEPRATQQEAIPHNEVEGIRFGHYLARRESRLQIATIAFISLPEGQQLHGTTSDISSSGAKIKVPSSFRYSLGQVLRISFPELAADCPNSPLETGIRYRILGIDDHQDSAIKWLRLCLVDEEPLLAPVLEAKIKQHKGTRHDIEDVLLQTRISGYEQYYLNHSNTLPLFFAGNELKYVQLSSNNQSLWNYWHDERKQPVMHHLFHADRMASLACAGLSHSRALIYCFDHIHQGKRYFYSATSTELSPEQRQLFWHLGATRPSWRVLRLTMHQLLPNEIDALSQDGMPIAPSIKALTHIGLLQDITPSSRGEDYLRVSKPTTPSSSLNHFCHGRHHKHQIETVYLDRKPKRKEPRYHFKIAVRIDDTQGNTLADGETIDFSARGLNIQLQSPVHLTSGSQICVSFPELQQKDPNAPLSQLLYKVVQLSPCGHNIRMTVEDSVDRHQGERFLRRLINFNLEKLTIEQEQIAAQDLLNHMHQLLLPRLNSLPFFSSKQDHKVTVKVLGVNFPLAPLPKLLQQCSHSRHFSLAPLLASRQQQLLVTPVRQRDKPQGLMTEIYLAAILESHQLPKLVAKLESDFESVQSRIQFIHQAQKVGQFFALRFHHSPISARPIELRQALEKLAKAKLHRARAIEDEFTNLVGCGELIDITDEVLVRLEIG